MENNCPFYGYHLSVSTRSIYLTLKDLEGNISKGISPQLHLIGTRGNQCALITDAFSPCLYESPDWRVCERVRAVSQAWPEMPPDPAELLQQLEEASRNITQMVNAGIVLHVLAEGLPLCRFTLHPPAAWPANHRWIGYRECRDGIIPPLPAHGALPTTPCPDCSRAIEILTRGTTT